MQRGSSANYKSEFLDLEAGWVNGDRVACATKTCLLQLKIARSSLATRRSCAVTRVLSKTGFECRRRPTERICLSLNGAFLCNASAMSSIVSLSMPALLGVLVATRRPSFSSQLTTAADSAFWTFSMRRLQGSVKN